VTVDPSVGFVLAPLLPVKDHFLSRPKAFQKLPRRLSGINGHTGLKTAFPYFAMFIIVFSLLPLIHAHDARRILVIVIISFAPEANLVLILINLLDPRGSNSLSGVPNYGLKP
jgi:hypothetical protein